MINDSFRGDPAVLGAAALVGGVDLHIFDPDVMRTLTSDAGHGQNESADCNQLRG
jgi:hypothetical protein